jgi:hypothetical protein
LVDLQHACRQRTLVRGVTRTPTEVNDVAASATRHYDLKCGTMDALTINAGEPR